MFMLTVLILIFIKKYKEVSMHFCECLIIECSHEKLKYQNIIKHNKMQTSIRLRKKREKTLKKVRLYFLQHF